MNANPNPEPNPDPNESKKTMDEFESMNDFFVRELKPECRPIADPEDDRTITSVADCRLMCFASHEEATKAKPSPPIWLATVFYRHVC